MRLLPLVPSAHPSAFTVEATPEHGQERLEPDASCRFCGRRCGDRLEVFHLDGDHANQLPENLVWACPICHSAQHLGHANVEREMTLIWLPEMSQSALNWLCVSLHQLWAALEGEPSLDRPPLIDSDDGRRAWRAHRALLAREAVCAERIGTSEVRVFGKALGELAQARKLDRSLLSGVRLLNRGRLFRAGRDVYPEMLAAF